MEGIGSPPPRVGVVFSSGFFGFFAHAGFLSALRESGIRPVAYAGASSGAIVAAMAACNMGDQTIRDILFRVRKEDFWDPDPWPLILRKGLSLFKGYTGYLRGDGYGGLLRALPERRIEDCDTPLAVVATNLTERRETLFMQGDLVRVLQASGAVPMMFKPVEIQGALYVDGGVVNKAPVKAVLRLADVERVVVHFIASREMGEDRHGFLKKRMTPWHIQYLAVSIARQASYEAQVEWARGRGVEVVEIRTDVPAVGPNRLERGPEAYVKAKRSALGELKRAGLCVADT